MSVLDLRRFVGFSKSYLGHLNSSYYKAQDQYVPYNSYREYCVSLFLYIGGILDFQKPNKSFLPGKIEIPGQINAWILRWFAKPYKKGWNMSK